MQRRRICSILARDNLISNYVMRSQAWTLVRYTNAAYVLIHLLIANYASKRIMYNLGFMVRVCYRLQPHNLTYSDIVINVATLRVLSMRFGQR